MALIQKVFNNSELACSISCFVKDDQVWFKGKDVASILEYKCPRRAIFDHVDNEDKVQFHRFSVGEVDLTPPTIDPQTILINESGLYSLIFGSKLEKAKMFKRWVTSEVLPAIRKTGQYQLRPKNITKQLCFKMETEKDLHYRIKNFIDEYYNGEILYNANLGELQDTSAKRIDAACRGYQAGSPDLEIKEQTKEHIGLCIEFKSPTGHGSLKPNQIEVHKELESRGYKVLCSNDYEFLLLQVKEYLDNRRYLCEYCKKRRKLFCSKHSRSQHYRFFHKIQ